MGSPKDVHVLIPKQVNIPFDGKKKKKISQGTRFGFEMGNNPGSPGWAFHAITNVLRRGRFEKGRESNVTRRQRLE